MNGNESSDRAGPLDDELPLDADLADVLEQRQLIDQTDHPATPDDTRDAEIDEGDAADQRVVVDFDDDAYDRAPPNPVQHTD